VERGVQRVLADGLRTADIDSEGKRRVGTSEMGAAVVAAL
jgi:3-isopropylmalate dehydrogenase